ncbi:MAG: HDIG domain-containing metalloprotein, partial [bacterium]
MFSFILKLKRYIKRLLKVQSESRQRPVYTARSRLFKIIMLIVAAGMIGILYPGEDLYDPFDVPRKGEISLDNIIAPFTITVFKTERELEDEKELIKLTIPFVIDQDTGAEGMALKNLNSFLTMVDTLSRDSGWVADEQKYVDLITKKFPLLSPNAVSQSLRRKDISEVRQSLVDIYNKDIYKIGVLPQLNAIPDARNKNVLISKGGNESITHRDELLDVVLANAKLLTALNKKYDVDSIDVEYYYLIGRSFIQPNLRVNMAEYNSRLKEEMDKISMVKEVVDEGNIIVRSGGKVHERQERILQEMVKMQQREAAKQGWFLNTLPALARIFLVLISLTMLYLFLYFFRKEIYYSNAKIMALLLAIGFQMLFIYIINQWELSSYLYPVAFLAVVVTILFDAEVGILSIVILALLLGIMHRFNFTLTFMTFIVGTVASLSSRKVRHRTKFFQIMLYVSVSTALFILLIENIRVTPQAEIFTEMGFGLVNGFIVILLTIGLLPFFEFLFGITTDITLLELSDLNHPLLKRLALEAPGTYQHSIIVGNISEEAAKAIGANSLLTRVGAYFHDIGKMEIPEYFVENQISIKSRHESLTPSMSSIILSSHVKKGRLLGEAADIPDDVLNFIEEHHGTMVQSYFYDKALKQGASEDNIDKFRYPGPRPQTRETGIAMLADAVEAASRTLDKPTPARLDALIQRIINARFQSGELDECPLTLRDLAKIRKAFAKVLVASFHHRVKYPQQKESMDG